jgi:NADH-quinone oxidoreductase subunit N
MSTLAKVVSMATLFKLLTVVNADLSPSFQTVIVVVSIASMTVGNIIIASSKCEKNVGILIHFGFMLDYLSIITCGTLLYYTSAYAFWLVWLLLVFYMLWMIY